MRNASHGLAICKLTDEAEITQRVEKMMTLAAVEGHEVPKVLSRFQDAANQPNLVTIIGLFQTVLGASARGVPRQVQLDNLMLDLAEYCLFRFPPAG
jgi:hypothetical protein